MFAMEQGTKESEGRIIPFAIFIFMGHFFYYFINLHLLSDPYESLSARIIATVLSFFLLLKNYWPKKLRSLLPAYWYITLLYSMPFFITFMALKNNAASSWMLNLLAVVVLMMLLVDWISYTVILLLGVFLAWIAYYVTTPQPFVYTPGVLSYGNLVDTFLSSIVMGVIFSRKKEKVEQEKLQAMKLLSTNIAHELRTPLAAINAGAGGIQDYLPDLIHGYELAKEYGISVPKISPSHSISAYRERTGKHASRNLFCKHCY